MQCFQLALWRCDGAATSIISTNMEMLQKGIQIHCITSDSSDYELLIRNQRHVQRKQVHTLLQVLRVPRTTIYDGPSIQTTHQRRNDKGGRNSMSKRNIFKLNGQIHILLADVPEIGNTKPQHHSRRKPTLLLKCRLARNDISSLHECSRKGNVHRIELAIERVLKGTIQRSEGATPARLHVQTTE